MAEVLSELSNGGCLVKTIIKTSTFTFNWTVENFSKFVLGTEKKSPTFHPLPNRAFYATLKLTKDLDGLLEFYHIPETSIEVKHHLSIENNAGRVILQYLTSYTYESCTSRTHCDVLPSCADIMKKARDENVLILKCVLEFSEEDQTDTYYYEPHPKPATPLECLSALSKDLQSMYETSVHADISLKVSDSVLRVHKSLVCARSPVFARMFETSMQESEENVIPITDLELPVLRDLVSYLYTGVLQKDDFESVYALYYAADKYDVSSLRKTCTDVLLSRLDVENASRVLALADRHSDRQLKDRAVHFIKLHFNQILETNAWDELIKIAPRLATEIISAWGKNQKDKVKTDKTNVLCKEANEMDA